MKLFQRLLVAPAALGLMAPVAANADSAFTSTTTLSGSAVFTVGSVADGGNDDKQEELYMQYAYSMDLNTSFTGEDLLTAGIETGNAGEKTGTSASPLAFMDSAADGDSKLSVKSLYYAFPVGNLSVTAGPLVDADDVIAATTSAYSDDFRLGSMPWSVNGDHTGPGIGIAFTGDNGFVASASFVSIDGNDAKVGIGGDKGDDVSVLSAGYNGEGWGLGLIMGSHDGDKTKANGGDSLGGGIYYSPESIPATISVAYDTVDPELKGAKDASDLFIGVDYEVGPGTLSAAYNSTDVDGGSSADSTGFEVSYSYAVNDSLTITPGFFTVEDTSTGDDDSGVVVETVFSF